MRTKQNAGAVVRPLVVSLAVAVPALAFTTGCGRTEPPAPEVGPAPAPSSEVGPVAKGLEDIKKDVTPPVIVSPAQPAAPTSEPGKR